MATAEIDAGLTQAMQEPTAHDEHLFVRMLVKRNELQSAIARRDGAQGEVNAASDRLTKCQAEVDAAIGALEAIYTEFKEGQPSC